MKPVKGEVAIDIREALLSSALQKLGALSDKPMVFDNFTIFRVPAHVRQRNKHLYEPQTVAIGPYGVGRNVEPSLQAMEWLKWRYLQEFLSRSSNSTIDRYIDEIQKLEPEARRCYFERVELSTKEFAEMLLLDGCFIVEFLIKWKGGENDGVCAVEWSLPLVRGDLLLLENQIPFFVLEKLYELRTFKIDGTAATPMQRRASEGEKPSSLKELLVKYLTSINIESPEEETDSSKKGKDDPGLIMPGEAKDFDHLLHLYYRCYVTTPQTDPTGRIICGTILKWLRPSRIAALLLFYITLLLSYIRSKICRSQAPAKKRSPRTIPSATELLEAGVTIKKKEKKEENQNKNQRRLSAFLDVAFDDGVLEIPLLSVENSTLPRFSNLVAFEQCGGCKPEKAYMTSYATFMNCLIDTPGDVAVLHKRGILENKLASDEELAAFFNQLADWSSLDYDNHYLAKLFREVGEYIGTPWPSWRAKLVSDYFSNPWAFISLIAAAVLLILTILQTVYSIYAYYHPRN
ncbi:putative UPF0481 protein [Ananas comosus]|uniref:Putative UPF0481 protein n=1 Tax=Ananas comosus TaxID=4615 RepID=A0A199V0R1_ANACO|nr:putative UPF0481 protein [Ananas comosus]